MKTPRDTSLFDHSLKNAEWENILKESWDPTYIFPLEDIGLGAYFLGVLYLMLSVMALLRIVKICKFTKNWTVTRTFYIFLFVSLLMRWLAFSTISGFEIFSDSDGFNSNILQLWFVLLFMIPAYLFTSVYLLLFLAYVEILIFSREQSVVTRTWFKKTWRYAFYIFNSFLYVAQGMSYAGVFIFQRSDEGKEITLNISNVLWISNFVLPFVALLSYAFITFRYAGFPFIDSIGKERYARMTRLFTIWSLCRVLYGLSMALSTAKSWTHDIPGTYVQMYVVAIAILTEGIPVLMALNWTIVSLLERQQWSFNYNELLPDLQEPMMWSTRVSVVGELSQEQIWQNIECQDIQLETAWKLKDRGNGFFSLNRGRWGNKDIVVKQFYTQALPKAAVLEITERCMKIVVSHPSINQVYGLSKNPDGSFGIISQFWDRNSLFDIIQASPSDKAFAYKIVVRIGIQICEAMEYLHSRGIRHGYLTTRNVLLDSEFNVKLSDYNLLNLKTYCAWMLNDTKFEGYWTEPCFPVGKPVTQKSDIYAFGYILWEMHTKEEPFKELTFKQISKKVRNGERPPMPTFMTDFIRELTNWCWNDEPIERPNFSMIKQSLLEERKV